MLYQLPSPKLQFHIAGVSPTVVSVNATASGAIPDEMLVVKAAVRNGAKMMAIVLPAEVEVSLSFETVRYTV